MNDTITKNRRNDLRCISVTDSVWKMIKELATKESESISAFIRYLIKKEYQRSKKKFEQVEVE